jgi:hypothetical protein
MRDGTGHGRAGETLVESRSQREMEAGMTEVLVGSQYGSFVETETDTPASVIPMNTDSLISDWSAS